MIILFILNLKCFISVLSLQYKQGDEEMSLLEAAKKFDMPAVIGYIEYQV